MLNRKAIEGGVILSDFSDVIYKIENETLRNTILKVYQKYYLIIAQLNEYDLNQAPVIAEIPLSVLQDSWCNKQVIYHPPSQFPSMDRDISLQVKRDVSSADLFRTIRSEGGKILTDVSLFDVYQAEDVGDDNKSLAFSLKFQSKASTLKDSEVDGVVTSILNSLNKAHGAIQR